MPSKRTKTTGADEQLTGPADTKDATVRVSSTPPRPTDTDHHTGTTAATTPVEPVSPPPLRLQGEPRIERYDVVAPDDTIVEATHNIDTGETSYKWTNRTAPQRPA